MYKKIYGNQVKWEPIDPDCGDLMSMEEWIKCVEEGSFIDYDGFGNYATEKVVSDITVHPSDVAEKRIDPKWKFIVWYNR